jgi:hypothetical protein
VFAKASEIKPALGVNKVITNTVADLLASVDHEIRLFIIDGFLAHLAETHSLEELRQCLSINTYTGSCMTGGTAATEGNSAIIPAILLRQRAGQQRSCGCEQGAWEGSPPCAFIALMTT